MYFDKLYYQYVFQFNRLMNSAIKTNPKLSIGMPVYNGEKHISKKLESILSQTFSDFELLITDDSTDSTSKICKEYVQKDKRINYFKNEKRMGWIWSVIYLIKKAAGDYFVLTSVDDVWTKNFLEKNISVLEKNKNVVGSISKLKRYEEKNEFDYESTDSTLNRLYKKIRRSFRPFGTFPLTGSYEEKAGRYLRNMSPLSIYALFRTNELRTGLAYKPSQTWEWIIILNVLKYGDLHVVDDDVLYYFMEGSSSKGLIDVYNQAQVSLFGVFFPFWDLFSWCTKNIGFKFFLKNFDHFFWLNCYNAIGVSLELIRSLKQKLSLF